MRPPMPPLLACLLTCTSAFALPPAGAPRISFEPNLGQAGPGAAFLARASGFTLVLSPAGAAFAGPPGGGPPLGMVLLGADLAGWRGEGALARRSHYLLGDDPGKWITEVPHYSRVACPGAYPGIDLVFHAAAGVLEYDLIAAPGADLEAIALRFPGARRLELDAAGDLLVHGVDGLLRHGKPVVYQRAPGAEPEAIACAYEIDGAGSEAIVRFR